MSVLITRAAKAEAHVDPIKSTARVRNPRSSSTDVWSDGRPSLALAPGLTLKWRAKLKKEASFCKKVTQHCPHRVMCERITNTQVEQRMANRKSTQNVTNAVTDPERRATEGRRSKAIDGCIRRERKIQKVLEKIKNCGKYHIRKNRPHREATWEAHAQYICNKDACDEETRTISKIISYTHMNVKFSLGARHFEATRFKIVGPSRIPFSKPMATTAEALAATGIQGTVHAQMLAAADPFLLLSDSSQVHPTLVRSDVVGGTLYAWLIALANGGAFLAATSFGALSDRRGRPAAILGVCVTTLIGLVFYALGLAFSMEQAPLLQLALPAIGCVLSGIGHEALRGPVLAMVSEDAPKVSGTQHAVSRRMALTLGTMGLGSSVESGVGGWLVRGSESDSWPSLAVILTCPGAQLACTTLHIASVPVRENAQRRARMDT